MKFASVTRWLWLGLALGAGGCATLGQAVKVGGQLSGYQDLAEAGESMSKASRDFTEEEKYYIGRTVAATLLADAPWKSEARLTTYINGVGSTLAQASTRPEMYHGYHFAFLEGKDVNAFACPGGFVFVSTGLLRLCGTEDELAAAMAHEIAHLVLEHPMQAISDAHQREAWASLAKFGLHKAGESQADLAQLSGLFDNVVKDVVKAVAQGYSRDKEQQADLLAVDILIQAGYHPQALAGLLGRMAGHSGYHGDPKERAKKVLEAAGGKTAPALLAARDKRFKQVSSH
jgi:beta-barrel assembly-enhancing protease